MTFERLIFSRLLIRNVTTVSEKNEFSLFKSRHIDEYIVRDVFLESAQARVFVTICHQERRNSAGKTSEVVFDIGIDLFLLLFLLTCFYRKNNGFPDIFHKWSYSFSQSFLKSFLCLFFFLVAFLVDSFNLCLC